MLLKDVIVALANDRPLHLPTTIDGEYAGIALVVTRKTPKNVLLRAAKSLIAKHGNIPVVDLWRANTEMKKLAEDREACLERMKEAEKKVEKPASKKTTKKAAKKTTKSK